MKLFDAILEGNTKQVIAILATTTSVATLLKACDDKKNTALHLAAQTGHDDVVQCLLHHKAAIEAWSRAQSTPLHWAVYKGHHKVVVSLLAHKADIEAKTNDLNMIALPPDSNAQWTALHITAGQKNNTSTLTHLLAQKAQIDARDCHQFTPLHIAAQAGHTHTVACLVKHKADLAAKNYDQNTPLHLATQKNHADTVKHLILLKANIEDPSSTGETPLLLASHFGHQNLALLLIDLKANIHQGAGYHGTPLCYAAAADLDKLTQTLIDHKADIEAQNQTLCTPLYLAASNGQRNTLLTLITAKANIEATSNDYWGIPFGSAKSQWRPMHISAYQGHHPVVQTLLNHKANFNAFDRNLETPLHLAAQKNHCHVARTLLTHKADIEVRNKHRCTPLYLAASSGHPQMVSLLIAHKANGNARSHDAQIALFGKTSTDQWTPLHISAAQGHLAVVKILLNHKICIDTLDEELETPLLCVIRFQSQKEVALALIEYKANVAAKNAQQESALHLAASWQAPFLDLADDMHDVQKSLPHFQDNEKEHQSIISILIEHKANVNDRCNHQSTPLHRAAGAMRLVAIAELFKHKADANGQDLNGQTPLHLALNASPHDAPCQKRTQIYSKIIDLLLDHKANIEARDAYQNTPLHLAATANNALQALSHHPKLNQKMWFYKNHKGQNAIHCATKNSEAINVITNLPDYHVHAWLAMDHKGENSFDYIIKHGTTTLINDILQHPTLSFLLSTQYATARSKGCCKIDLIEQFNQCIKSLDFSQIKTNRWHHLLGPHLDTIVMGKSMWLAMIMQTMRYHQEDVLQKIVAKAKIDTQLAHTITHKLLSWAIFYPNDYVLLRTLAYPKPLFFTPQHLLLSQQNLTNRLRNACKNLYSPIRNWLVQLDCHQNKQCSDLLGTSCRSLLSPFYNTTENNPWERNIAQFLQGHSVASLVLTSYYYYHRFHPLAKIDYVLNRYKPAPTLPPATVYSPSQSPISSDDDVAFDSLPDAPRLERTYS